MLSQAQDAVALPVIAVRQLPALAAPHRKKIVEQTPVQTHDPGDPDAAAAERRRRTHPSEQPQKPQNTTPKNNSGSGGGGGSGGYFDQSG